MPANIPPKGAVALKGSLLAIQAEKHENPLRVTLTHQKGYSGRRAGQRFDAQYGVTTEALIFLGDLNAQLVGSSVAHATHYEPTPVNDFFEFMDALALDFAATTFVDVGSGMGRVVFLAAKHPFKQIIGIELSPALHEVAAENLKSWVDPRQCCKDIRLARADAATFGFPLGHLVLYLYNPFGRPVLTALLENVLANTQTTRDLILCYHTPVEREVIESTKAFELLVEFNFGCVYRLRQREPDAHPSRGTDLAS
ncbi:MAG: class I SAM-dependent methyltransferase [Candidatus Eremiobacteraeota bacterium]|nr:class I SAM-dependent methyltransferase [Candidatus Eremiobacteraeota bacterium]